VIATVVAPDVIAAYDAELMTVPVPGVIPENAVIGI
jgi:hypothetical protein